MTISDLSEGFPEVFVICNSVHTTIVKAFLIRWRIAWPQFGHIFSWVTMIFSLGNLGSIYEWGNTSFLLEMFSAHWQDLNEIYCFQNIRTYHWKCRYISDAQSSHGWAGGRCFFFFFRKNVMASLNIYWRLVSMVFMIISIFQTKLFGWEKD